jgi:hypothetical protein
MKKNYDVTKSKIDLITSLDPSLIVTLILKSPSGKKVMACLLAVIFVPTTEPIHGHGLKKFGALNFMLSKPSFANGFIFACPVTISHQSNFATLKTFLNRPFTSRKYSNVVFNQMRIKFMRN